MNGKFFEKKVAKFGFVAFALALGLAACGDGGSTNGPSNNHEGANVSSVESEDDLPSCTESREGFVNFIDGTKEGFVCKDRKWGHYDMIADIDDNLPGCTGSREGLSAYLYEENRELKCVDGGWEKIGEEARSSSSVTPGSSSSVIPSEVEGSSSSSKANWAYLNPNIDYGEFTDERDGQVYKTVKIGTQTWMAENLNYEYNKGTAKSYCNKDEMSNCTKYGRLYLWSAAMDSAAVFSTSGKDCGYGKTCSPTGTIRGVCPEGWHLPSKDEWNALFTAVGGSSTAGVKLKSVEGWKYYSESTTGTDVYGFSALPAGYRGSNGGFHNVGNSAYFWSSTVDNSDRAYGMDLFYNHEDAGLGYSYKYNARSVRCLKDSSSVTSSSSVASSSSSSVIPGTDPGSPSSSSVIQSSSSEGTSIKDGSKYDASAKTLTDSRDGQVYKTVTIGTQTWMAENLNYRYVGVKYNLDGFTSDSTSWCYENKASNCDKYGRLYTWSAVMDSAAQFNVNAGTKCGYDKTCTPNRPHRGICPEGWHVPTNEEYSTLYTYIGGSSTAGSLLKSTSGWYNSGNGTDKYGFSVLPAGSRSYRGSFNNEGRSAYLWSAFENFSSYAWGQYFYYDYGYARQDGNNKFSGLSLRCLKDSSPTSGEATSSSSQAKPSSSSSSVASSSSSSVIPGSSSSVIPDTDPGSPVYGTLTDSRDNQVYKTVTIGTQTWMAENLNYAYTGVEYNYGSYTSDSTSWCYDNKASNCDKYGRLYTWSAVMDSAAQFNVNAGTKCGYGKTCTPNSPHRGICPEGWHVPTNEEYSTLYTYIGGSSTAGKMLKSTSGWNDYNGKSGNGTDKHGFSVLPAGLRGNYGSFSREGYSAYLWSASEYSSYDAWYQYFSYDGGNAGQNRDYKHYGRSLRCLKD